MSHFYFQLHRPPLHRLNFSIYDQGRQVPYFPQRNIPPWNRPAQESDWLRRQRELAVPATGPDPYAHVLQPEPQSYYNLILEFQGQWLRNLKAAMTAFLKDLARLIMSLTVTFGHCLASLWVAIEKVDFWILGAAVLAWCLIGSASEEVLVPERRAEELAFRLVPDIRSWGVAGCHHAFRI